VVLIFTFLMISDFEHFFMYLTILISFFEKCLFFSPMLSWIVGIFIVQHFSLLHILAINLLLDE
jgi:hypothetical protein